jgi:amino acid adenylation domain-containing protein
VYDSKIEALHGLSSAQRETLKRKLKHRGIDPMSVPVLKRPPDLAVIPTSFAQQRLWLLDQVDTGNAVYNVPATVRLVGPLDIDALARALNEVVRRHEVLRTTFDVVDDMPVQVVAPALALDLPQSDLSALPEIQRAQQARELAMQEAWTCFDLAAGPLARARLVRMAENEHILLLTLHHIVSDAWSMGLLAREVASLYRAYSLGEQSALPPLAIQYADYAHWQRHWLGNDLLQAQVDYWKRQLADAPALSTLPADRPRPLVQTHRGVTLVLSLPAQLTAALHTVALQAQGTLFMVLAAAFNVLLWRHSGQDDLCIGMPVASRTRAELEPLIGLFVNTLVLRTRLHRSATFSQLLQQVKASTLDAYAHQDVPFEQVVEALRPQRNTAHSPLFQVMLALQNTPMQALELAGLRFEALGRENPQAMFDLTLTILEGDEQLKIEFEYNTDLFDAGRIEGLAEQFTRLLENVVADPQRPIGQLQPLGDAERDRVLVQSNGPLMAYPRESTIHQLFEAQAKRAPEAVAVVLEEVSVTYAEMNARANRLARFLRGQGVGPDTRVAICVERGVPMVVGLWAILKAGGAYVPLDPSYPRERLAYMLQDCRPAALLTDAACMHQFPPQETVPVFSVDEDEARWRDLPADNLAVETLGLNARHLAYVIYTSGSTGAPKGVQVAHMSLVNYALAAAATYALTPADRVLQGSSISFDIAVDEIFATLAAGATLVLGPWPRLPSIAEFNAVMERRGLTVLNLPTAYWHEWVAAMETDRAPLPDTLRLVVVGGEAASASRLERWRVLAGDQVAWINSYGPSETTAGVTFGRVRAGEPVHIGSPIANTHLYVLDASGQLVPMGAPGEIHIGGVQVARGYLNRPELTAERFVPDPYSSEPGTRMYKTGDLGRWRADGTIEFLGRNDDQVKLRGFRIELGEIEVRLRQHPDVRDAVVLARKEAPGDPRLVAYIVGQQVSPEALRAHLSAQLPEYMVPAAYVQLHALPLTPNGKLDRKALPAPQADALAQTAYTAPHTETERAVAALWSQLLAVPIEHIGRESDFFGHSLLAVRVVSQVQQALQRTLPLREIFAHRTLHALAAHLDAQAPTAPLPPIAPVSRDRALPLAPVQERLWVVHQMQGQQTSYNMAMALQLQGPLSMPALQAAFDDLLQRHETLRTRFVADADGQPRQVIEPTLRLDIPVRQAGRDEVPARAAEHAAQVFDLGRAPLLSVQVLRLGKQDHVLLLNMHHIISDGWSMNVLAHDMQQLYAAQLQGVPAQLPALGVQYVDHAHSVRQQDMAAHTAYWAQALHGYEPGLTLPLDRPAQPRPSAARALTVDYPAELCASLGTLCAQHGTTLFMALTAALSVVLQRYTGRTDLCLGTTVAGRDRAELEPLIGFFVNIVALRLDVSGDLTGSALLEHVKDRSLQAFEHQALPFEQVLQQLKLSGDRAQELVPVMVRHQNLPDTVGTQWGDGLTVEVLPGSEQSAKCPLDLQFFGDTAGLRATVEYAADLFDEATVRRLLQHHQRVLQHMVLLPQQSLSSLILLTADERQLIGQCNQTARELDEALSVVAQFERRVQDTPDACACIDEQGQLSYAELNVRANRIAHALRERGVGPEVRVGLYMPRSCEFIAAMLGIFKAGGVYVPLDPNAPPAYLQRLIDDAQPQLLMHGEQPPEAACAGMEMLGVAQASSQGPQTNLAVPWSAQQLLMLAYTSGSTGQPKGVGVPHGQLLNLLQSMQAKLPLGADDVVAQKTMAPFVVSMKELLGALLAGVPQVVVSDALLKDPPAFIAALQRDKVSRLFIVPSHLQAVLEALDDPQALSRLKVCVTAGEPLTQQLRERVQRTLPWVALWNNFGCTELNDTAYCDPQHLGGSGQFVPIGWPIDNMQVHVLDTQLRELPLGVVGELCVSTAWMARGYWREPQLTAQRFVPNPYGEPGSRLYRTGDMVRRLADGSLEYLGREDFDIKIRGQRVDVRQVEAVLARCEGVQLAAVGAWNDHRDEVRLVAYVVPEAGQSLLSTRLRGQLAAQLPAFMVPSLYVSLDALPRTATGKLDRKSLPAPPADALAQPPHLALQTPTERAVADIWSQILEVPFERIGQDDDFFALGGHSLQAARVAARVQQSLRRPLQVRDIFASTSLRALAHHIDALAVMHPPILARTNIQQDAPLSFPQQNLWWLDRLEPGNPAFNLSVSVRLPGDVIVPALEHAFRMVVDRHEVLRTTFHHEDGVLLQRIGPPGRACVEEVDLSAIDHDRQALALQSHCRQQIATRFDLSRGPLIRLHVIRLAHAETVVHLVLHHIVADSWSMKLLVHELKALYAACAEGTQTPLQALPVQYADYAVWQRTTLQGEWLDRQVQYWAQQLAGAPQLLSLPTDRPRPPVQTYRGRTLGRRIDPSLLQSAKRLAQAQRVTLFSLMLGVFKTLLWRYSGQTDIVVGTAVANRSHPDLEQLIGMFANTLALRTVLSPEGTFSELLAQIHGTALDAYMNQDVPFERVVEELRLPRSASHTPLYQVMLTLHNTPDLETDSEPDSVESQGEFSEFDLRVDLFESENRLTMFWEYNQDLFDESTACRMLGHFERLLRDAVARPDTPLGSLSLLDEPELLSLQHVSARQVFDAECCIHELFEQHAARTPEACALVFEDTTLTYAELNARANALAHHLIAVGVRPDACVALLLPRGIDMVVGLLATLKAGGSYVPLDVAYPAERLANMLADCAPRLLLTLSSVRNLAGPLPQALDVLDLDDGAAWQHQPVTNPDRVALGLTPGHLAYVIYTSGSTGRPKGVMVEHAQVVRLLRATQAWFEFGAADVWTMFHSYAFDFSVWELWGALAYGGRLVVVPQLTTRSPCEFYDLLCEQGVTVLNQTPSAFRQLIAAQADSVRPHQLRFIVFGGEALEPATLAPWYARNGAGTRLVNMYGITETTVHVTHRPLAMDDTTRSASPIGVPIPDLCVSLLDAYGQPVPIGVAGEMYVGGAGVTRGYLNRPDLTAERFVPDRYSTAPGARMYKTGDIARRRADGTLEFLGRNDHQVKIRGFRIEVGEIESALLRLPGVREAVVAVREDTPGDRRLVAYLTGDACAPETIRTLLAQWLPHYMVPSAFVHLECLPLTPNGKLDRAALPMPQIDAYAARPYEPPQGEVEAMLAELWCELFKLERVGRHDNFFDLGGHSLLALQMVSRASARLQREVPVRLVFSAQTIEALAREIANLHAGNNLVPVRKSGHLAPLFVIHAGDGEVGYAFDLAPHLPPDRPVYALAAIGFADGEVPLADVEAMASTYVRAMRTVQPVGPYHVVGWSAGGTIAYEIAAQLLSQGQHVRFVAVIDTLGDYSARRGPSGQGLTEAQFLADFVRDEIDHALADQLVELAERDDIDAMLDLCQIHGAFPAQIERATLRRHLAVRCAIGLAVTSYRARPIAAPLTVYAAADEARPDPRLGWDAITAHELEVVELPGTHWSIVDPAHIAALGSAISQALAALA